MRIIKFNDFIKLPANTVYCEFDVGFSNLYVKMDSIGDDDFFYKDLLQNIDVKNSDEFMDFIETRDKDISMDFDTVSRDGMFDYSREFAIFDNDDIKGLIKVLQECVCRN